MVPFDQNGCVCQTSTQAQIEIPLVFPKVVSKVDLTNKCHESTNNCNVIDVSAHSDPPHINSNRDRTGVFSKL